MRPLSTLTTPPAPNTPHTHTVIFLHGRGDTATNFQHAFTQWQDSQSRSLADLFPAIKWVFPQSEIRPLARFPRGKTSQWFDTWDIGNLSHKEELQVDGLRESVQSIKELLEKEVEEVDGNWGRLVLAGLSQGGATAVHVLVNLEKENKLGGLMVFSGRMPFPGRSLEETRAVLGTIIGAGGCSGDEVVRNTPALVQHCADDPLSRVENGRAVRDSLEGFGTKVVTWREYPTGGHWFHSPGGIEDAAEWLRQYVLQEGDEGKDCR
ncbi:putative acyl-protein thioesterase [Cladorrhinum sp. PSN332]|nr:putative acyl-protein thioesterase [Cladorrhinum sp. PSN332]